MHKSVGTGALMRFDLLTTELERIAFDAHGNRGPYFQEAGEAPASAAGAGRFLQSPRSHLRAGAS